MGFPFAKFFSTLTAIAPAILLAVPGGAALAPMVPLIVAGIAHEQAIAGKSGADKKAAVLQLVADSVAGTNLVKPGTIDPALVQVAAGHAIDAVITSVQAVQAAHAALPSVPAIVG
jgi:hypothetical protein